MNVIFTLTLKMTLWINEKGTDSFSLFPNWGGYFAVSNFAISLANLATVNVGSEQRPSLQ